MALLKSPSFQYTRLTRHGVSGRAERGRGDERPTHELGSGPRGATLEGVTCAMLHGACVEAQRALKRRC